MKIEEAIELLQKYKEESEEDYYIRRAEALEMAIEALEQQPTDAVDRVTIKEYLESFGNVKTEQEPCDDAISRQAVLDLVADYDLSMGQVVKCIHALPPVLPQSKMGKWVKHDTGHSIYYDCSLCSCVAPCTETADKILWKLTNYCPDCGAKMQEVEE